MAIISVEDDFDWQHHEPTGGGAFPGEVSVEEDGLFIRDVLDRKGKGFKTEFNLETMTYQFYSECNEGILRKFVQKGLKYLFPVCSLSSGRLCFGYLTVTAYVKMTPAKYLRKCVACGGRVPHEVRHVLKLGEAYLVDKRHAFPLYAEGVWDQLGCARPETCKGLMYWASKEQAKGLVSFLERGDNLRERYLERTLRLKRELKQGYGTIIKEEREHEMHVAHLLHLKGLMEETDYFSRCGAEL